MSGQQAAGPRSPEAMLLAQSWEEGGRRLRAAYLSNASEDVRRVEAASLKAIGAQFARVCGVGERGIEFDRAMGAARTALTQQRVLEERAKKKEQPRVFEMQYECECGVAWTDQWSCACNDECPGCKREIEPTAWRVLGEPENLPLATVAANGQAGASESGGESEEQALGGGGVLKHWPAEEDSAMPGL